MFSIDRGFVIAHDPNGRYLLARVFASFPSELDGEIKRFGRHIGRFIPSDNESYTRWVYRFLME